MAHETNKLTDQFITSLDVSKAGKKFFDGRGLYIFVSDIGTKLWRMKYFFNVLMVEKEYLALAPTLMLV